MYFVSMAVLLRPDSPVLLGIEHAAHAHAAVMQAISTANQDLGRQLHDTLRNKRLTLAIVDSTEQSATLRLTFMCQEGLAYAETLADALDRRSLRIGSTDCFVECIDLSHPVWGYVSTWADLCRGPVSDRLPFAFVTPTAITKDGPNHRRISSLLPTPRDVFTNLLWRWKALEGPPLSDNLDLHLQADACIVASHSIETREFFTRERTQIGYVGDITYKCVSGGAPVVSALNALTRLAFYSGIGYQTARGMGAVRIGLPLS